MSRLMPTTTLHLGDSLTVMATMEANSVDAIVTDPPYGLSDHKPQDVIDCLRAWLNGEAYQPNKRGFMGKGWDGWVAGPEVWREALRVLKPGGHLLCFAGTRSMDLMSLAIRLAGFELRDSIGYASDGGGAPLLAWCHGQGFPKGQGQLKPAWEPIILARAPLDKSPWLVELTPEVLETWEARRCVYD